jgi:hypothetical protein
MSSENERFFYHSKCYSDFTAVGKRKTEASSESPAPDEPPPKVTRSASQHSQADRRTGVLGNQCIFCPFSRRRSNFSQKLQYETPHPISSRNSAAAIMEAAQLQDNDTSRTILAIPGDLLAKEAKCHDSCKRNFIKAGKALTNPKEDSGQETVRTRHSKAFEHLSLFLKDEVVRKGKPMLASTIFALYRQEFINAGGRDEEINDYSVQSLLKKVVQIAGIQTAKQASIGGWFAFPQSMANEEAINLLKVSTIEEEHVRCAALAVRSEITSLPRTSIPTPTSVHALKEAAASIPRLTGLFFHTVMNGLSTPDNPPSERKINAMASDTVFNVSHGTVRPWKSTVLGLGISSMTGSKAAVTVLNRQGHSISYSAIKELETEIAYSCMSQERETPFGLVQSDNLATGMKCFSFSSIQGNSLEMNNHLTLSCRL